MAKALEPRGEQGKHTSFAGGRLTFLKLGSASVGFVGVSEIFLKATSSQIIAFQCDREILPVAQSSMHAYVVF